MSAIFSGCCNHTSITCTSSLIHPIPSPLFSTIPLSSTSRLFSPKFPIIPQSNHSSRPKNRVICSSSKSVAVDEWLERLPDKEKPLYAHSLPCIEAWLKSLGFHQSKEDRSVWFVEKLDWNAQLSLDVTDLCIRYLKSGPGNLEKDMERRFSYALSRQDIENAILGGP